MVGALDSQAGPPDVAAGAGAPTPSIGMSHPTPTGRPLPAAPLELLRREADDAEAFADAPNTSTSYQSDQASWESFCRTLGVDPYPADIEHVRLYLTQLVRFGGRAGRPLRPRSAERHLAGIAAAHRAKNVPFDSAHPRLRRCLNGLKRKFGIRQYGSDPLRTDALRQICRLMGNDPLAVRDRALLLVGYAGGFRRTALVGFDIGDVNYVPEGMILDLMRDKTDSFAEGRLVGICHGTHPETCPVEALRAWSRVAEHHYAERTAPLFTGIDRWGALDPFGERLSDKAVDRAVKRWARRAGLVGAFSAHSLRAGHVTEARSRAGHAVRAQQQLGHASAATTDRYDRTSLWERNSSAALGL